MTVIYSLDDISAHRKMDDIWMTIHNKIYNITVFMKDVFEQSFDIINSNDATAAFDHIGHSDDACETLKQYYIVDLGVKVRRKKKNKGFYN
ncbi:hypothetical protein K501DRAFT_176584 [Backusella circina FSU 941]|nr:hypothetical protein K501DRAFT_176584 [Backusella circina FSU 941]